MQDVVEIKTERKFIKKLVPGKDIISEKRHSKKE